METNKITKVRFCYVSLFLVSYLSFLAQDSFDSLNIKLPKHYFNTVIGFDSYRKPERVFRDTSTQISKRLGSYGIRQLTINFQAPISTKIWMDADSTIKNSHLLITGTYMNLRPIFANLEQHRLVKFGIGIRYIYNTGKKGVWFIDVSPFVTRDATFSVESFYRLASTFVYSHNVSPSFNWRVGATKSFLWGNRFYLPFIGFRFGKLDKVNLSIQFPRALNLHVPLSDKTIFSMYSRVQGGVFNFSNSDSLYFNATENNFHFARYELNTGARFDFRMGKHFILYVASGFSTRNAIAFYSESANQRRRNVSYNTYFFSKQLPPSLFFNLGFVLQFGKTKSFFNDKNIYDAIDLNNTQNFDNGNVNIPLPAKNMSKYNLESVQDLVDYSDF